MKLQDVQSVYTGAFGKCCCGCAGKHRYPTSQKDNGKKLRGYEIGTEEVSDRAVKLAFNKVKRALEGKSEDWVVDYNYKDFVSVKNVTETRVTVVYLKGE